MRVVSCRALVWVERSKLLAQDLFVQDVFFEFRPASSNKMVEYSSDLSGFLQVCLYEATAQALNRCSGSSRWKDGSKLDADAVLSWI